jgi:NADPH-dependent 2,4-dienoyl-CoA reductase/sulfur reductase-like enzyme
MKVVVVGGVAGGMSFAARARRLAEDAQIVVHERDAYVSYANCGLPYHLAGEITDRSARAVHGRRPDHPPDRQRGPAPG